VRAGKKSGSTLPRTTHLPADAPTIAIPYPPGRSGRVAEEPQSIAHFTAREKEVGSWLAEGLSDGEIAGELRIGVHTVKAHVSELLRKTRMPARTQFMAWVWRNRFAFELAQRDSRKPVKYA
jgi:DNA-binding CsgD family transcriptional regulator